MTRLTSCIAVILLAASTCVINAQAPAADAPAEPVLGYVFESAGRTIHPVLGTLDAAQLGDALPFSAIAAFVAAPGRDYGLALAAATGAAFFIELAPSGASASPISAVNDGTDRIVLSPTGGAAAFYDRQSRSVQIASGLPEARRVSSPIQLGDLGGLITAMAVNDAGDSLLVGIAGESGGSLHLVGPSRNPRKIIDATRIASIAFLPDSGDAVIADHGRNEVVLIRDIAGSPAASVLAGSQDGIVEPGSIAASRDGLSVYVGSSQRGRVTRLVIAGGAASSLDCDCRPDRLVPLAGNAVFALTAPPSSPLYVYDGDRKTGDRVDPRIVLVPSANPAKLTQPGPARPPHVRRGRSPR